MVEGCVSGGLIGVNFHRAAKRLNISLQWVAKGSMQAASHVRRLDAFICSTEGR